MYKVQDSGNINKYNIRNIREKKIKIVRFYYNSGEAPRSG